MDIIKSGLKDTLVGMKYLLYVILPIVALWLIFWMGERIFGEIFMVIAPGVLVFVLASFFLGFVKRHLC